MSEKDPLLIPLREETQIPLIPDIYSEYREGRDELNLAEFPISAVGTRVDDSVKTIVFQDTAMDKSDGHIVERKLTITASARYGLPTATDDEVLLGLVQLSRIRDFDSPTVPFTLFHLLKILGWPRTGPNFLRAKESIDRWMGVTLYYQNAWRDKSTGKWVDANFHVIEQVEFHKPGQESAVAPEGYSVFKWNEVVFRNFKAGNIKALDFHLYRSIKSKIGKRMFRFLDKRFYMRPKLTFGLEAFCRDKVGITLQLKGRPGGRTVVDIAQAKRRLMTAIEELEMLQFIRPMSPEERFTRGVTGRWDIHFERYSAASPEAPACVPEIDEMTPTEGRLIGHGVSPEQARKLVSTFDNDRVKKHLDILEYLLAKGGKSAPRGRAGWLVAAITQDYTAPPGFKTMEQLDEEARIKAESARRKEEARRLELAEQEAARAQEEAEWKKNRERVTAYLSSISARERDELERKALDASPLRGKITKRLRDSIIFNFVMCILDDQDAARQQTGRKPTTPELF